MRGKGGHGVTALQSWGDQDGLKTEQEPCKSICQTLIENVWVLLAPLWALCGSSVTHNQRPKELPDSSLREWSRSGMGYGPGGVSLLVSTSSGARLLGRDWLVLRLRSCSNAQA